MDTVSSRVDRICDVLPQTQCRQCGFNGCKAYAEAIVQGKTTIDRCTPGGAQVIEVLMPWANSSFQKIALHPKHQPLTVPHTVKIREEACIGCTKCIQACPMDAIIGAAKQMHTVMTKDCTGCDLCIPVCPVDCIDLIPLPEKEVQEFLSPERILQNRQLFERRQKRNNRGRLKIAMQNKNNIKNRSVRLNNTTLVHRALCAQQRRLQRQYHGEVDAEKRAHLEHHMHDLKQKLSVLENKKISGRTVA